MELFRRTSPGLGNYVRFARTDLLVLVEGGTQHVSKEQALAGEGGIEAFDLRYWEAVFDHFRPHLSICFRSVGSKPTLKSIAADIRAGRVPNVCVAMDRDHDNHADALVLAPGIFYTFGYSWENDVYSTEVLADVAQVLLPMAGTREYVEQRLEEEAGLCVAQLRWFVRADVTLGLIGSSLFYRDSSMRNLRCIPPDLPTIWREGLQERLREIRAAFGKFHLVRRPVGCTVFVDCYGHLIEDWAYHTVVALVSESERAVKISRQQFAAFAIDKFALRLRQGRLRHIANHYNDAFYGFEEEWSEEDPESEGS